jgi:hypothetical protein
LDAGKERKMQVLTVLEPEQLFEAECAEVPVVYVYLCDGRVEEVTPATGVQLTREHVVIVGEDGPIVRFRRADVYFASREAVATPVLF